jgi:2-isopropylmalate synthase
MRRRGLLLPALLSLWLSLPAGDSFVPLAPPTATPASATRTEGAAAAAAAAAGDSAACAPPFVQFYDTTLRDGTQMEGISVSVNDKIKIARELHLFGMHYIEGGWPGSNPKDAEFFERAVTELDPEAWEKIVAFGSTRRKRMSCAEDPQLASLIAAGTRAVTIVAKAWDLHVDKILEVDREENLNMVGESVEFLKAAGKEVHLDLEHFFDGYKANPAYTLEVCQRAVDAGVDVLVLCDTNGGTLPWEMEEPMSILSKSYEGVRVGIHCHNDQDLAVCNSIQAVRNGASVIQGTVNGIGERTGNANLMSIIPTLQLKMGVEGVGESLRNMTALSRYTDEQLNQIPDHRKPYVGMSAFAHKGGIHVSAVNKIPESYQHIDPADVGNLRRVLVSELSGRSNILSKVQEFGMGSEEDFSKPEWKARMGHVLEKVKELEMKGYTFEGADASVNLMIRRMMPGYTLPFKLLDYSVTSSDRKLYTSSRDSKSSANVQSTRATVKLRVPARAVDPLLHLWEPSADPFVVLESAEGNGPVNALSRALFKALLPSRPSLQHVTLTDYKVG